MNIHFRGEWIVPNFEEIWPSGKPRRRNKGPGIPTKGPEYIEYAMKTGIPGEKDKDFTTVGKPKVSVNSKLIYRFSMNKLGVSLFLN